MMTSIDGRIDCAMTAQLPGNDTYYSTLNALNAPTRISGKVTAAKELTTGVKFITPDSTPIGKTSFSKIQDAPSYNICVDTKGNLRWGREQSAHHPHLIITREQASKEYLNYLDHQGISWIASGQERVDLAAAMQILADRFNVNRLVIVGGGRINGGFLEADLINELSVVIGPGIDGRTHQPSLFDGRPANSHPAILRLKNVQSYNDGSIWLRYLTK